MRAGFNAGDIPLDTRPNRKMCELHYIYCAAAARGRSGAGTALWSAVERAALKAGCTHMELTADSTQTEPLIKFYQEKCGLSYMFCRLRKELTPHPPNLSPRPFPFQHLRGVATLQVMVAQDATSTTSTTTRTSATSTSGGVPVIRTVTLSDSVSGWGDSLLVELAAGAGITGNPRQLQVSVRDPAGEEEVVLPGGRLSWRMLTSLGPDDVVIVQQL